MAMTVSRGEPVPALSTRELIGAIMDRATLLIKTEAELARAELKADLQSELAVAKGLVIALVSAVIGLNALLMAVVLALAVWMPGWLAALIIGVVMLMLAAVVGGVSWSRRVMPLTATRRMLREDLRWVKEQLAWTTGGSPR